MQKTLGQLKRLSELRKLETAPLSQLPEAGPEKTVTAIVKVHEADYVPLQVKVRARIDQTLFTAEFPLSLLHSLEADPKVRSVALSRPLQQSGT